MRSSIIVFAGFLESGKTTAINKFLNKSQNEKIIIIQCETGLEEVQDKSRTIVEVEDFEAINSKFFEDILIKYPNYDIWIEYNGTWQLSKLYQISLPKGVVIEKVFYYMDYTTADIYLSNMPTLILEQINFADKLIFTKHDGKLFTSGDRIIEVIKTLNPNMEIKSSDDDTIISDKKSIIPYILASIILLLYILLLLNSKR